MLEVRTLNTLCVARTRSRASLSTAYLIRDPGMVPALAYNATFNKMQLLHGWRQVAAPNAP
jgi:hypothetical protein